MIGIQLIIIPTPPVYDPQGPVKGNEKVLRGYVGGDRQYALTIFRQSSQPVPKFAGRDDYQKFGVSPLLYFVALLINNIV